MNRWIKYLALGLLLCATALWSQTWRPVQYQEADLTLSLSNLLSSNLLAGANVLISKDASGRLTFSTSGGIATNGNQFLGVPLSIKSGAGLSNVFLYSATLITNTVTFSMITEDVGGVVETEPEGLDGMYHAALAQGLEFAETSHEVGLWRTLGGYSPGATEIAVWDEDAGGYKFAAGAITIDGSVTSSIDINAGQITLIIPTVFNAGIQAPTNSGTFPTTGIGQTNPIVSGKFWTNTFGSRVELAVNLQLSSSAVSGAPSMCCTNISTGESYNSTNSAVLAAVFSDRATFLLSPNDYVIFTNKSSGNASASVVSSRAIKM